MRIEGVNLVRILHTSGSKTETKSSFKGSQKTVIAIAAIAK